MRVTVVPYDPVWPLAFEAIRKELLVILGPDFNGQIEHVGSTSAPGMWAKPLVDIDIIAPLESHAGITAALVNSQRYLNQGRDDIFERTNFKYIPPPNANGAGQYANAKRNVYLTAPDSLGLKNHLAIRTVLRQRPDLVEAYSNVKRKLAETDYDHVDEYVAGKSEVLGKILGAAGGFTTAEMERIRGGNLAPGEQP